MFVAAEASQENTNASLCSGSKSEKAIDLTRKEQPADEPQMRTGFFDPTTNPSMMNETEEPTDEGMNDLRGNSHIFKGRPEIDRVSELHTLNLNKEVIWHGKCMGCLRNTILTPLPFPAKTYRRIETIQ